MKRIAVVAATLVGAALVGCAAGPSGGSELIGTLEVDGPNAFRNGRPTDDGARVFHGDTISTGARTSMRLRFVGGGVLQLDENTDPQLLREGACILVRILTGQAFVDAKRVCIADSNLEVTLNSRANLKIVGQRSTLTLIEGSAEMGRPERRAVGQYAQYIVIGGVVDSVQRLRREDAEATANWTRRYFKAAEQSGWCCVGDAVGQSTAERCSAARGRFYTDESVARRDCAPQSPSGWCCAAGRVNESTKSACDARYGRFYIDKQAASAACVKADPNRPIQ